jgi:thiol-disulfide isomerase/thioredoxin
MKKLIFTAILFCFYFALHAQEIIETPRYGMSSTGYITLTKVELTGDATILSFHVKIPQYNWVAIHEKSYIQPVGDTTRLYITKAEGAEIATRIVWEKDKMEEISYRLFFPPIDADVARIDYGEPVENSWNFYDIEVREVPHQSPVPVELSGHWFSEETGHWTFSFLDSVAVYGGKAWKYNSVSPSENGYTIRLKNGNNETTLLCRSDKSSCLMQSDNDPMGKYSKDPTLMERITDTKPFDVPVVNPGKVTYSGYVRGFSTRLETRTGLIRYANPLTNRQETFVIPIQKDGSFIVEFPVDFPQEITVNLPSGSERVFFEPGKPLFHLANAGIPDSPSLFMGESAAVNYSLNKTREIVTPMMSFIEGIITMSDKEYIDHVFEARKDELEKLEELQKKISISNKARQIRLFDIHYRAANNAVRYNGNISLAKIYANRNLKDDEKLPVGSVDFDINLLNRFSETPVNDELAFISNEYFFLLQSLRYTDIKRQQSSYYYRLQELGKQVTDNGAILSGEEKDMLEYIRLNLIQTFDQEKSRNFNKAYGAVVQKFSEKYKEEFLELSNRFYIENLKENLSAMGLNGVLPMEISRAQTYLSKLESDSPILNEEDFKEIKTALHNSYLKELVISSYYRKKAEMEVTANAITTELKTEGDKLFESIIKKYRGKVIYVDFWATWCGPCLSGIEKIKPLKEELAGKDVVFLYITNPSSPEAEYKKRIPDIKGEHVKVTTDEWNYLTEKFNIFGIPHYALVGKKGNLVNARLMHMENDALKQRLMEQLDK